MGVVDDQIDSDVWVPVRKNFVFYPLVRLVLFFFSSVCLPSNEIGCFSVGLFLESIDKFKLCQCYVMGYLLPEVNFCHTTCMVIKFSLTCLVVSFYILFAFLNTSLSHQMDREIFQEQLRRNADIWIHYFATPGISLLYIIFGTSMRTTGDFAIFILMH